MTTTPTSDHALVPSEPEDDLSAAESDDLEARRRRVKQKAEALRDRLKGEAEKIDDARRDARAFVVRHRWPLLGAVTAFGFALARRRPRRERVVVVQPSTSHRSLAAIVAGRALELAAKAAIDQVQAHLDERSVTRTAGGDDDDDGPAGRGAAPTRSGPGSRTTPRPDHGEPGGPDR